MNQKERLMTIHSKSECAMASPKLDPRSRNERPAEKFFISDAILANRTYRTIRWILARKKNRKIIAASEPISMTHEASFMSFTVRSAAAGGFTSRSDQPKNIMIMKVSKNRSTTIVATEAVSGVCSRRATQSGRMTSPARPSTKIAENPTRFALMGGLMRMGLTVSKRTCHRTARNTYVRNVADLEAMSKL